MTPEPEELGDIFDVRNFRRLVELMRDHDLNEVDLKRGDVRIRLRRGAEPPVTSGPPAMLPSVAAPVAVPSLAAKPAEIKPAVEEKGTLIRSPLVGTYYSAPNPESPPCVKIGDQVGPDTTVCIIEAMKVFSEVPAECAGKIVGILVDNGDAVEFNQPLFRVEPR